jgi:hypothetical protein
VICFGLMARYRDATKVLGLTWRDDRPKAGCLRMALGLRTALGLRMTSAEKKRSWPSGWSLLRQIEAVSGLVLETSFGFI